MADGDEYMFDLDCLQQMCEGGGRAIENLHLAPAALQAAVQDAGEEPDFAVDGKYMGNVSRFINHDTQPNLFMQATVPALRAFILTF